MPPELQPVMRTDLRVIMLKLAISVWRRLRWHGGGYKVWV